MAGSKGSHQLSVKSNDGLSILDKNILSDGSFGTTGTVATLEVTSAGLYYNNRYIFVYVGDKVFKGFATSANATEPTYRIGSTFTFGTVGATNDETLILYIVEGGYEFDLSTLNLSAGTHEITVKARASGYADSPASNAVSYVVAGDTVQVSGKWYFNLVPSISSIQNVDYFESVSFVSNGVSFKNLLVTHKGYYIRCMPTNGEKGDEIYIYDNDTGWLDQAYRTITFDGTQTVSKEFYEWLVANATRQTISFTIENAHNYDTTTYYADVGMTWAEWCDSEYNTRGGFILNDTVMVWCYPNGEEYNSGLKDVVPTDVISNGGAYVATTDGPCRS